MNTKMQRFLTSIGLRDIERFDMDFTLAGRDPNNHEQIDMFIQKETPWDPDLLGEFLEALNSISYPYLIRFSYTQEIKASDVMLLMDTFMFDHFESSLPEFSINADGNLVALIEEDSREEQERGLASFKDFLSFIQYPTSILVQYKKKETAPMEAPQEATLADQGFVPVQECEPAQKEEAEEELKPEEAAAKIQEDFKAAQQAGEEELLREQEENYKVMMEERRQAKLRKTGNYTFIDRIEDIYSIHEGNVDFAGDVFEADCRLTKRGFQMANIGVGDSTGAISILAFSGRSIEESKLTGLAPKMRIRVRGAIDIDDRTHQKRIRAHYIDMLPPTPLRDDDPSLPLKRVELHLHTNMSVMDGLPEFKDYYKLAKHMGMKAIAVTDHGVVQSFPDAQAARDGDKSGDPLKILFGCELYMFDMKQTIIMNPCDRPLSKSRYCVFDTETTGLSARYDRLVEFGGVIVENGMVVSSLNLLINPQMKMPLGSSSVNHITDAMLADKPTIEEAMPKILEFLGDNILVAHNATFDIGFLNAALQRLGKPALQNPVIDTLPLSHYFFPKAGRHNEGALLKNLGLNDVYDDSDAHRAEYDATALNEGWQVMLRRLEETYPGIKHKDLDELQVELPDIEDVERDNADEGNFSRFTRAMNYFMKFWRFQFPKDKIATSFASYEEAHAEYRRVAEDPNPESKDMTGKPLLCQHLNEMKLSFNSFCRHVKEYHVIVFAKNAQGLKDLYKIVTQGHTNYLARIPKTPRSLIEAYRKNFLVGSACFNGEIFELASTRSKDALVEAMKFYDYIELQPLDNYSYLIHMERVQSKETLLEMLRDIVDAAKTAGKKVVATGDCHYLNPEDKILRDVYIDAKAIGGGAHPMNPPARAKYPPFENPSQHFRSTREMLDCFEEWMSKEEAEEVVIANSNWVAEQIEDHITPVSKDVFAPNENIPNSAGQLRDLCYGTFEREYSYTLDSDPKVLAAVDFVKKRLDRELEGIIGHGYAVTYFIAHKLIKLAGEEPEHFIVGSRGSVGSSFAATMAGITEVNALPPHYHCPHCHYLTFEDEDGVNFLKKGVKSGFDLPNKVCPKCGTPLKANGQNIPFETFLGFQADKVPDIDLNFEEESQHRAHNYTRLLLGPHNVFRAGTIETVAEKTAYGYVRGYFEHILERQGKSVESVNPTFIAYLASRCQGVKRTTGQHPGGIVVVPSNMSVYDFTAVQHPADDLESDWLTTHYDFASMHDEILKFDILGHVDPMAMRYYRDLTKVRIEDIPMNDPKVLSLFTSPRELKLRNNYLNATTGATALPEFGTDTTNGVLEVAQPKTFNDLLIISGISHGTDVWSGNAEDLIKSHTTTLNGVIGCRDDIMSYLILQGVEPSKAFKIMEFVRKNKAGKPLPEDMVKTMQDAKVPDWYIESCRKIKYLFPRGHATAYVMMAVRVAYFKLYYPLQFYAVFFSIRSDAYDIETMVEGENAIIAKINALRARKNDRINPLSNKEANILKTLIVALEMVERGYSFEKIDLYRSDYKMFVVDEERKALIPPFKVIDGLGESAGKSVIEARERLGGKEFLSKDQLLDMTKLSSTNVADLDKLGSLEGLPDSNQLTLF